MAKNFEIRSVSQLSRWRGYLKEAISVTPALVGETTPEVAAKFAANLADELFLQDMRRKSILSAYKKEILGISEEEE